jgi:hypothetical protein
MALPNVGNSCFLNAATQLLADAMIVQGLAPSLPQHKRDVAKEYMETLLQLRGLRVEIELENGLGNVGQHVAIDSVTHKDGRQQMIKYMQLCDRELYRRDDPQEVFNAVAEYFKLSLAPTTVQYWQCLCTECNGKVEPPANIGIATGVATYRYNCNTHRCPPEEKVPKDAEPVYSLDLEELLCRLPTCTTNANHVTICGLESGAGSWIIHVQREEEDDVQQRVLVRFPFQLGSTFALMARTKTDMYLRGFIVNNGGHYVYVVRHNDGVWWEYDDNHVKLVSPLCAANEYLLSYVYGREVTDLLYEYRSDDYPDYPLEPNFDVDPADKTLMAAIVEQGTNLRAVEAEIRAEEFRDHIPTAARLTSWFM